MSDITETTETGNVTFATEITFSANVIDMGDYVLVEGKAFELGDYPDKKFSLDETEADAAIANFRPVEGNDNHPTEQHKRGSVLHGKLGKLVAVWRTGQDIMARWALPKPLYALFSPNNPGVSLEFTYDPKRIVGFAWTLTPRVADAAIAAFSDAAQHPKETAMPEKETPPVDRVAALESAVAEFVTTFSGAPISKVNMSKLRDAHNAITDVASEACPANGAKMSAPALPPEVQQQLDRANAQIRELQQRDREREAAHFSDAALTNKQLLPAETALVTAFAAALMEADQTRGNTVVSFSDGTTSTLMDMFRRVIGMRPAHSLTQELVPFGSYTALGQSAGTDGNKDEAEVAQKRRDHLLALARGGKTPVKGGE